MGPHPGGAAELGLWSRSVQLIDPGTGAMDDRITLNELTIGNLTTILDPGSDARFDIDPLEIKATGSLAG